MYTQKQLYRLIKRETRKNIKEKKVYRATFCGHKGRFNLCSPFFFSRKNCVMNAHRTFELPMIF